MLAITAAIIILILIAARKPLARAAKQLAKRAAKALWKRLTTKMFGHCRTCAAVAIPLHTCVVKASKRPAVKAGTAAGIMAKRDAKATRNGWLQPVGKLIQVSRECADGECLLCNTPGCDHCDHDADRITAEYAADYDAKHPATDTVPF